MYRGSSNTYTSVLFSPDPLGINAEACENLLKLEDKYLDKNKLKLHFVSFPLALYFY